MALLKFKGTEPRELSIYGVFHPGQIKQVKDEAAKNLVIANPEFWEIVTPPGAVEERRKKYADDRKLDTKKEE